MGYHGHGQELKFKDGSFGISKWATKWFGISN